MHKMQEIYINCTCYWIVATVTNDESSETVFGKRIRILLVYYSGLDILKFFFFGCKYLNYL